MSDEEFIVTVDGCDDSTSVRVQLTPAQAEVVEKVAAKITERSEYQCMPTMKVTPVAEADAYLLRAAQEDKQ